MLSGGAGRATLGRSSRAVAADQQQGQGIDVPDDEHDAAVGRPAPRIPADSDPAAGHTSSLPMSHVQSGLRLDELLREVQERLA